MIFELKHWDPVAAGSSSRISPCFIATSGSTATATQRYGCTREYGYATKQAFRSVGF